MKLTLFVKPNAKVQKIERLLDGSYKVSVKEPPLEGKANRAVIKAVAEHFKLPISSVQITSGLTSKLKIVEIAVN